MNLKASYSSRQPTARGRRTLNDFKEQLAIIQNLPHVGPRFEHPRRALLRRRVLLKAK